MSFLAISLFALVSAPKALAANVLFELDNATATVYYDLTNELCGNNDPFVNDWAELSGINNGVPKCEQFSTNGQSLAQLGTNQIVAMNEDMVSGNLEEWCGKEVAVFLPDGSQFQFSEGPLILWDACAACITLPRVDMSAKAFTQIKGGTCGGNNPGDLKVQILDNNIMQPILPGGATGGATPSPTSAETVIGASISVAVSAGISVNFRENDNVATAPAASSPTANNSPLPSPTGSSGSCTYGAWQCDGTAIQVCNYEDATSLGWVTVGTCPSKCSISSSGNVDCE